SGPWRIAKALFRQADLLAKSFQPRIAAKQGVFWERQPPPHPNRPNRSGAIQSFESAILVAQTGEDDGLVEWVLVAGCQLFRILPAAGPRIGVAKIAPSLIPLVNVPIEDCFE